MMDSSRIIITGGDGMVGSQADFGIRLNRSELDILDPDSIENAIAKYQPETILHLAAMTNIMACDQNPELAHQINVIGTRNLASACAHHNIKLVYVSTCVVFDGHKTAPYAESDLPNPQSIYAKTKYAGELAIKEIVSNYLIIRAGWMFGGDNLQSKFLQRMFHLMMNGESFTATSDRVGSPTYIPDFLTEVERLIKLDTTGIVHVVNSGVASFAQIAEEIKKAGGFAGIATPVLAKSVEPPEEKRGYMEGLTSDISKLRDWKEAVRSYINYLELTRTSSGVK